MRQIHMELENHRNTKALNANPNQMEDIQETIAMLALILQGEQDLIAGRYRPAADVFRELKQRYT